MSAPQHADPASASLRDELGITTTAPAATDDTSTTPPLDEGDHIKEKLRATLAARLALAGGWTLLELADGSFLVSRWDRSRHCADLREVDAFARQVGAPD